MDPRFRGRIKSALRKLTWVWEPYKNVKNAAKVAPSTFQCSNCLKCCYTGTSQKNFEKIKSELPKYNIVMEKTVYIDHISPVEPVDGKWHGWDFFMESLFCGEENLQCLCSACHDPKTSAEDKERNANKRKLKNGKVKPRRTTRANRKRREEEKSSS